MRLFSIQQVHGLDQLRPAEGVFPVTELGARLNQATGPFMDTAAVMMNLDLVISCDSSPAHLAGALRAPVWMAIPNTPDWRWLSHREDTPWYPSMRIFRQRERMVWSSVFERMAAELRRLVRSRSRMPTVTVAIAPGELIDRITRLELRAERLADPVELKEARTELAGLMAARERSLFDPTEVADLAAELRDVNEALWTTEERIREHERAGDFGPEFVEAGAGRCPGTTTVARRSRGGSTGTAEWNPAGNRL